MITEQKVQEMIEHIDADLAETSTDQYLEILTELNALILDRIESVQSDIVSEGEKE